jgi:hypothetical protein
MVDNTPFMTSLTEDDLNLAREAGVDLSEFLQGDVFKREGYRPVEEKDYETSWSDWGRQLVGVGGSSLAGSTAAGIEYLTRGAVGGDARRYFEGVTQEQTQALSPVFRRAFQSEFIPEAGKDSIFDNFALSLGAKTVAAIPSIVASIIPAGVAAAALRGASVATRVGVAGAAARGTAGLQAGGGVAGQIYSTIEKMSDQELQDKAPIYAGYRSMMPEAEARRQYMNDVAGAAPAAAFLLTTALGGIEGQVAGRLAGGAATGFLRGAGRGAAAEAAQETVESGGGELLAQLALSNQNLAQINWQKILSQGLEGGLVGGALGGGVGGITGMGAREQATAPAVVPPKGAGTGVAVQPAADPEIGDPNARPVGSETQYAKPPSFTLDTFRSRLAGKGIEFPEDRLEEIQSRIDAANELPNARRGAAVRKLLNEFYAAAPAAPPAPGGTQTVAPGVQVGNGPDAAQAAALGVALPVKPVPPQVSAAVQRQTAPAAPAPAAPAPARATPPVPAPVAAAVQRQAAPVDTGTNLQEPSADLLAQQQRLVRGETSVQMFPTNTQPLPLPKGMKEVTTPRGVFHYNPKAKIGGKAVNKGLIERLSAAGRENELLGLGDRTKQEVAAKAPTEGGVTTVSETTPEGARVRSVAATAADAERQAQMLQETSAPENTVLIEPTEETLAPRKSVKVDNPFPQLEKGDVASRLKAANARIRDALFGKGTLLVKDATVRLSDLVSQQDWIEPARKAPALATDSLPVVVSVDGKLVIRDGNHRLAAMLDRGDQTARVKLIELVAPAPTAPRILQDISPEGQAATAAAAAADEARRARIAEEELAKERKAASEARAETVEGKVGKEAMLTKDQRRAAKAAEDEKVAAEIVANNPPTDVEANLQSKDGAERKAAMQAMYDRLKKMVTEAEQRGVSIPERQRKQSNELVLLMRAKNFLADRAPAAAKGGLGTVKPYQNFVAVETTLRAGGEAARSERDRAKAEAEAAKKPTGPAPEAAVTEERGTLSQAAEEMAMSPEERMIASEEAANAENYVRSEEEVKEFLAQGRERESVIKSKADEVLAKVRERKKKAEELAERGATEGERKAAAAAVTRIVKSEETVAEKAQELAIKEFVTAGTSQEGKFKVAKRPVAEKFRPTVTGKISLKPKAAAAVAVAKKAEPAQQPPSVMRTPADEVASGRSDDVIILGPIELVLYPNQVTYFTTGEDGLAIKQDRQSFGRPGEIGLTALPDSRVPKALHEPIRAYVEGEITRDEFYKQIQELARTALEKKIEPPQPRASAAQQGALLSSYTDEELANGMTKRQNRTDGDQSATEVDRVLDQLANRLPPDLQDEYFRLRTEYAFADATDASFALSDLIEFLRANDTPVARAARGRVLQRANYQPVTPTGPTVRMAGVDITPIQTTDVARTLRLTSDDLYAVFRDGPARLFATFFKDRMTKRVGNIPVYIITDEDMQRLSAETYWWLPEDARPTFNGLYHDGKIALRAAVLADPVAGLEIAMHEALHAWSEDAINSDPNLQKALDRLVDVAAARLFPNERKPYGLTDRYELISEAFSNPQFREFLASIELPNNIRAEIEQLLGPVKGPMKSIWDAFIQMIRAKMGLGDTLANYTILDAVMRAGTRIDTIVERRGVIGDRAMVQRPAAAPRASLSAQDIINSSIDRKNAAASWGKRNWSKFMTGSQMRQQYADTVIGPALKKIWESVSATGPRIQEIKDAGDKLATRAIDLSSKYDKEFRSLVQIMEEARMMDVNIEGNNAHLGKDATKGWQAKARIVPLQSRFAALPTELKQLYREMAAYYRNSHNEIVKASVSSILEGLQLRQARGKAKGNALTDQQITELTQRVMDQDMTAADKALLGVTVFNALKNAAAFHRIRGDYFPLMRYGDHVVTTTDKILDTMGGKLETPDTVLFRDKSNAAARRAAEAFVKKSDLVHMSTEKVFIDNTTGQEVSEDDAKSLNDVDIGYRVTMQTKGVYFFESGKAAEEFARTNPEGHDQISRPEIRLGSGYQAQIMSGTQVASLNSAIDGRVKSGDITSGQGDLLKSIVNQAATRMLGGNRIASRRLKSQKVTGASSDVARNLLQYNAAAANHIAVAENAPVIRDGLAEIDAALKDYSGPDRPQLLAVSEEVKARIDQGIVDPNAPGKVMRDIMSLSFLARLFSPAYSVVNGMQPWMVTLPVLGGRFGNMVASAAMSRAYNDIGLGDVALQGVLNTARATKQTFKAALLGTDDIVGNIRKKLAATNDGADLTRMMDELIRQNAIDVSAGLEVAASAAEGRGKWGKTLAGVDRIARQLPQMVEAVNRTVTAVSAYRLARKDGQTHEQATQFALNTVQNTQGDYSAANAPRFFNNPILRPALQFKKYAQMMTYLLGDMAYRTFNGATPEEKRIALKQFGNILGVQVLMAGALSLPGLEIIKAGFLVASMFGIGGGWDEQEDKLRKLLDDSVGKTWGELISSGILSRAVGIDLSQRMSLADMWLFGEPKNDTAESMQAYLFRQAVGAPGGYVLDVVEAGKLAQDGDWWKAAGKLVPAKFAGDFAKAVHNYGEAKYEEPERRKVSGLGEAAVNVFGFRTGRQAELGRETGVAIRERQDKQKEFQKLMKQYRTARTKGDMAKAIAKNREWNANLSRGEFRMKLPVKPRELRAPQ